MASVGRKTFKLVASKMGLEKVRLRKHSDPDRQSLWSQKCALIVARTVLLYRWLLLGNNL